MPSSAIRGSMTSVRDVRLLMRSQMYLLRQLLRLLLFLRGRLLNLMSQAHGLALRFWLCKSRQMCFRMISHRLYVLPTFIVCGCCCGGLPALRLKFLEIPRIRANVKILPRNTALQCGPPLRGSCPSTCSCNSCCSAIRPKLSTAHVVNRDAYSENIVQTEHIPTSTLRTLMFIQPLHSRLSVTDLIG